MKLFLFLLLPVILLTSCSKQPEVTPALPITLDKPTVDLHYDGSYQYNLSQGGSVVDPSTFTWTSSNPDAGSISAAGNFTAKRIGQTVIKGLSKDNKNGVQSVITVVPYSTAWTEPITTFGVNKASIKLAEKRSLSDETGNGLVYYGETDKIRGVLYLFTADKLTSAGVLPENTSAMAVETSTFLKERYDYIGIKDKVYFFTDNKKVSIGLTVDDQIGLTVIYLPYSTGGRLSMDSINSSFKSQLIKQQSLYKF